MGLFNKLKQFKTMETINRKIIAQLATIARDYFKYLDITPGTYTAAELAASKEAKHAEDDHWEPVTVGAGSFACEIPRARVFAVLAQFEKLEGITKREKTVFIKEAERAGAVTFFATLTKEDAKAGAFCGSDILLRYNFTHLHINFSAGALCASNTVVLYSQNINIDITPESQESAKAAGLFCTINPRHIKNMVGRVKIMMYKDEDGASVTEITNEAGEVFINKYNRNKVPDFARVLNNNTYCEDGYIQVTPDSAKALGKMAKGLKDRETTILLKITSGHETATATATDDDGNTRVITMQLAGPARCSLTVGVSPDEFAKCATLWAGGMWFKSPSHPIVLDTANGATVLLFPYKHPDSCGEVNPGTKAIFPASERAAHIPEELAANVVKLATKERKTRKTTAKATAPECTPVNVATGEDVITHAPDDDAKPEQITAYINAIAVFVDALVCLVYRTELYNTVARLKQLATLAGVPISDIVADLTAETAEAQSVTIETPPPPIQATTGGTPPVYPVAPSHPRLLYITVTVPATMIIARPPTWRDTATIHAGALCLDVTGWGRCRRGYPRIRDGTN